MLEKYLSSLDSKTRQTQTSILNRYFENQSEFMTNLKTLSNSTQKNYLAVISAYKTFEIDHTQATSEINQKVLEIQEKRLAKEKKESMKKLDEIARQKEELSKILAQVETLEIFESEDIPKSFKEFNVNEFIPDQSWAVKEFTGSNYENFEKLAGIQNNIILTGSAGTGKSESVIKFCAKNQIPLFKFSCTSETNENQIFMSKTLDVESDKQIIKNIAGLGLKAIFTANKVGKACLFLDEINVLPNQIQKMLNGFGDNTRFLDLPELKVKLNKGVKLYIFGSMNENYTGTQNLNKDLIDRFAFINFEVVSNDNLKNIFSKKYDYLQDSEIEKILNFKTKFDNLKKDNRIGDNVEFSFRAIDLYCKLRSTYDHYEALKISLYDKITDKDDKVTVMSL